MISHQQKQNLRERAITETKKFIAIALYLWVLLSVFELHRFSVLRDLNLNALFGYRFGFAALNALILGKVILIGQALHVGEHFSEKRLIYSALFKSAIFSLLLVCFEVIEEVIVGLIHGKSLLASIPQFGGGGLEGKLIVGLLAFVTLIPFFLFIEVQQVLGKENLRKLLFQDRSKADAA